VDASQGGGGGRYRSCIGDDDNAARRRLDPDPDQHETYMAERNGTLSYQLKPLVRMLKRWNRVHSERLESFHLEVMTASMFQSLGSN